MEYLPNRLVEYQWGGESNFGQNSPKCSHLWYLSFSNHVKTLPKLPGFGGISSSRYLKHILLFSNSKYSWRYEVLKFWKNRKIHQISILFIPDFMKIHHFVWKVWNPSKIHPKSENFGKFVLINSVLNVWSSNFSLRM